MRKVITFDLYHTLLDFDPVYEKIGEIASRNNLDANLAIQRYINYEDRLMYGEVYIPYDALVMENLSYIDMELRTDVFEKAFMEMREAYRQLKPFDDVLPALRLFKEKGYELYILSNTNHGLIEYHLMQFEGLFDGYHTATDSKCYKPQLKFFQDAERKLQLNHANHCHIATSYWWDIVPCTTMGWNKVWLNRKHCIKNARHPDVRESDTLMSIAQLAK